MYKYEWDIQTGGYLLTTTSASVVGREVRPVYNHELNILGFDKYWNYPQDDSRPLLWAETNTYSYRGRLVAKTNGGGIYTAPVIDIIEDNLTLEPVDIELMVKKNRVIMNSIVNDTLKNTYDTFSAYKKKVDVFYVAFSGGKDSIVLLDIVQRALPHNEFVVVFGDTDMELSDTYDAVKAVEARYPTIKFYTAKSHLTAEQSWGIFGPPSRTLRWCCSVHKSAPSLLKLREIHKKTNFKAMVFDGIRREESNPRNDYDFIGDNVKHRQQFNCHPIIDWSAAELYNYVYQESLLINQAYKKGLNRVGCVLCPMAPARFEYVKNTSYNTEVQKYVNIITNSVKDNYSRIIQKSDYFETESWKARKSGDEIKQGVENLIINEDDSTLTIRASLKIDSLWREWIKTVGDIIKISDSKYILVYKGSECEFTYLTSEDEFEFKIYVSKGNNQKIKLISLIKSVFRKAAYCIGCGSCMVECLSGSIDWSQGIKISKSCSKCGNCHSLDYGCLVARSLLLNRGKSKMKCTNRYLKFGFREEFLELFLKLGCDFYHTDLIGKPKINSFKKWLFEAELIDEKNNLTQLSHNLREKILSKPCVWGMIFVNLCCNSEYIRWYINNIEFNDEISINYLYNALGDETNSDSKNAVITPIKETLRHSPLGESIGAGVLRKKGIETFVLRLPWQNPDPVVILYSLFKFAEKCGGYYSFSLSRLYDTEADGEGLTPYQIFGIDKDTLTKIINGLSINHGDFISSSFTHDLDSINLNRDKRSLDVLNLL